MQDIVLDNIKFPTGKEKDGARFRQIQEERLNRNFRRLLENDANKNSATALPDSIRVGDNIDIYKPTVHHGAVLEQFGSTVATHSASGNYAKILTFGTDVKVSKNLLNDINPDVKNAYLTGAYKLGASANDRTVIIPINPNTYYTFTRNRVAIEGASSDDTNVLLFAEYPVIGTTVGTSTGVNTTSNPAVRTFYSGSNIYCAIKIANITKTKYQETLSASQLEIGSSSTSHEPYVDTSDLSVNAPITLEYVKTGDVSPTTLTIVFNRDYSLQSFTKDASADAYLVNSSTAHWDLYIGKSSASDSVEILDMHNPWSNTDMTIDWEVTSVSTLPTGAVQAESVNTNIEVNANVVSVASGTWTNTGSITLTKGTWIITAFAQFSTNTTGRRQALISETSASSTSVRGMMTDNQAPVDGAVTLCRFMDIYTVTSATKTLYLNSYQNSGSTMNVYGRIYAIKIV